MKLLITGNAGYIGTHLSEMLPHAMGCDIKGGCDYRTLEGEWDAVVHLAASVSVVESFSDPNMYYENNWLGLQTFFRRNRVGRFVFASTGGAMYGNRHSARESDVDLTGASPYAKSKFLAEQLIRTFHPDYCILRLANVHGGNSSVRGEAAVHAHFQHDKPIKVYGGNQTRDFIHIDTVCEAFRRAVRGDMVGTYNIGSGEETAILDLARTAGAARGVPVNVLPSRPCELDYVSLNCAAAHEAGLL